MHTHTTGCGIIRGRVAGCDFLFIYPGQSVRIIVMLVRIKLPKEARYMVMEFFVTGFPSKRHDDLLVDEWRIRDNAAFLVRPLIKRK